MPTEIHLLNGSSLRERELHGTTHVVESIFGVPVRLRRADLDMAAAYDRIRHQSNSTALLAQILRVNENPALKRIAVVEADLFIPVLTFVFGEAQLSGSAAIVSTHRLHNRFYGMPEDHGLMVERLQKEIVHELGHTFGLYHCHQFECVMRSSTYVEEIDMKRIEPCPNCAEALKDLQVKVQHQPRA